MRDKQRTVYLIDWKFLIALFRFNVHSGTQQSQSKIDSFSERHYKELYGKIHSNPHLFSIGKCDKTESIHNVQVGISESVPRTFRKRYGNRNLMHFGTAFCSWNIPRVENKLYCIKFTVIARGMKWSESLIANSSCIAMTFPYFAA